MTGEEHQERRTSRPTQRDLLKTLFGTRSQVLMLVATLIGLGFVLATGLTESDSLWHDLWLALGTGLLATALYSMFTSLLQRDQLEQVLDQVLVEGVERMEQAALGRLESSERSVLEAINGLHADQATEHRQALASIRVNLAQDVATMQQQFMPIQEFAATTGFDDSYNRSLMDDIANSHSFAFSGTSARFVVSRLNRLRTPPQLIRVTMMDPRRRASVSRRAADRMAWGSSSHKSMAELEQDLIDEIAMSTISLFDYRTRCPVDIAYTDNEGVYRMELTDSSLYLSWYHRPASGGQEMPGAMRFPAQTVWYQIFNQEISRRFEVLSDKIHLDSSTSDESLLTHVNALVGQEWTMSDIELLRQRQRESTVKFNEYLKELG